MRKGDRVYTPRFCTVEIKEVFENRDAAFNAGYTEPTYYQDAEYDIRGKSLDLYHMTFAAYHK